METKFIIIIALGAVLLLAAPIVLFMFNKKLNSFKYQVDEKYLGRMFYFYDEEERKKDVGKASSFALNFALPEKSPFIIVCPGGAFQNVGINQEGIPTALELNKLGYSVFLLKYRIGKYSKAPNPQEDLAKLIDYIYNNAVRLNVKTDGYGILGYSAGGHLVGSFGLKDIGYGRFNVKSPDVIIMGYPVVTMRGVKYVEFHIGDKPNEATLAKYSVDENVGKDYPPVFMWRRRDDVAVPGDGAHRLVEQLKKHNIPYVFEEYEGTEHGEHVGIGTPMEGWIKRAVEFWEKQKNKE